MLQSSPGFYIVVFLFEVFLYRKPFLSKLLGSREQAGKILSQREVLFDESRTAGTPGSRGQCLVDLHCAQAADYPASRDLFLVLIHSYWMAYQNEHWSPRSLLSKVPGRPPVFTTAHCNRSMPGSSLQNYYECVTVSYVHTIHCGYILQPLTLESVFLSLTSLPLAFPWKKMIPCAAASNRGP